MTADRKEFNDTINAILGTQGATNEPHPTTPTLEEWIAQRTAKTHQTSDTGESDIHLAPGARTEVPGRRSR